MHPNRSLVNLELIFNHFGKNVAMRICVYMSIEGTINNRVWNYLLDSRFKKGHLLNISLVKIPTNICLDKSMRKEENHSI